MRVFPSASGYEFSTDSLKRTLDVAWALFTLWSQVVELTENCRKKSVDKIFVSVMLS